MKREAWLKQLASPERYPSPRWRQPFKGRWPNGTGLALYVAMNLEHFSFGCQEGAKIAPPNQLDVLNYAWRDYGNRVGGWYLAELFEQLGIPPALICNTSILDAYPELAERWLACAGAEMIAHGHTNSERQGELTAAAEGEMIGYCRERLARFAGQPIHGWLSPWISESRHTPELLAEKGFHYTLNWAHDDLPTPFHTACGSLLSVPYPQEINDIPAIVPNGTDITAFCTMIEAQFEELLERSQQGLQVMGIALHPYIIGQPFRFHHLKHTLARLLARRDEYWLATPGQIAEHFNRLPGVQNDA